MSERVCLIQEEMQTSRLLYRFRQISFEGSSIKDIIPNTIAMS